MNCEQPRNTLKNLETLRNNNFKNEINVYIDVEKRENRESEMRILGLDQQIGIDSSIQTRRIPFLWAGFSRPVHRERNWPVVGFDMTLIESPLRFLISIGRWRGGDDSGGCPNDDTEQLSSQRLRCRFGIPVGWMTSPRREARMSSPDWFIDRIGSVGWVYWLTVCNWMSDVHKLML